MPWHMLPIMVMNDSVPIAVTVARWSENSTSKKLNTAVSYLGHCYVSSFPANWTLS